MKKIFTLLFILVLPISVYSQSYIGWIIKQVNFRESPSIDAPILSSLKAGSQIFIVSLDAENDYYSIIDIETNTEGYVYKKFVKFGKQVKENEQGILRQAVKQLLIILILKYSITPT